MALLDVRLHVDGLSLERNELSFWQIIERLWPHINPFCWLLFVFFIFVAPNVYVLSMALHAYCTKEEDAMSGRLPQWLKGAAQRAEVIAQYARPWAMLDVLVITFWVAVCSLQTEDLTALEGMPFIPIGGPIGRLFSGPGLITCAGLALTALRWLWFKPADGKLLSWVVPLTLAVWFLSCFVTGGSLYGAVVDFPSLQSWLVRVRPRMNWALSQQPATRGHCSFVGDTVLNSVQPYPEQLMPPQPCSGFTSLYKIINKQMHVNVEWLAGWDTMKLSQMKVLHQLGGFLLDITLEMQYARIFLHGQVCKGICAEVNEAIQWGRHECAVEGEWCNCQNGQMTYGHDVTNERPGGRMCLAALFGMEDSSRVLFESSFDAASQNKCYCKPENAVTGEPTKLHLQVDAKCTGGAHPELSLSMRDLDLTKLDLDMQIKLWGWFSVRRAWLDASAMLLPVMKHNFGDYLNGSKHLPVLNESLQDFVNDIVSVNSKTGSFTCW